MESLLLDVRHAVRVLVRRPAFTALSVVTLAIGIGVNVIAFAAVNALIFKSLDVPEAARTGWVLVREPGILLGLGGALAAGRVLSAALFGVSPADPLAFGATAAIPGYGRAGRLPHPCLACHANGPDRGTQARLIRSPGHPI